MKVDIPHPQLMPANLDSLSADQTELTVTHEWHEDTPGNTGEVAAQTRYTIPLVGDDAPEDIRQALGKVYRLAVQWIQTKELKGPRDNPCETCVSARCCSREYSPAPYVSDADVAALAAHLGTTREDVLETLVVEQPHWAQPALIGYLDWGDEGVCPLLEDDGKQMRCSVYPVRPQECVLGAERNCYLAETETTDDD